MKNVRRTKESRGNNILKNVNKLAYNIEVVDPVSNSVRAQS